MLSVTPITLSTFTFPVHFFIRKWVRLMTFERRLNFFLKGESSGKDGEEHYYYLNLTALCNLWYFTYFNLTDPHISLLRRARSELIPLTEGQIETQNSKVLHKLTKQETQVRQEHPSLWPLISSDLFIIPPIYIKAAAE